MYVLFLAATYWQWKNINHKYELQQAKSFLNSVVSLIFILFGLCVMSIQ